MTAAAALPLLLLITGCSALQREPDNANARAFSAYQPLCLFMCSATGEATQVETGTATTGPFSVTREERPRLLDRLPKRKGKTK